MTEASPLVHRVRLERERFVSRAGAVQPLVGIAAMLLIVAALSLLLADEEMLRRVAAEIVAARR